MVREVGGAVFLKDAGVAWPIIGSNSRPPSKAGTASAWTLGTDFFINNIVEIGENKHKRLCNKVLQQSLSLNHCLNFQVIDCFFLLEE